MNAEDDKKFCEMVKSIAKIKDYNLYRDEAFDLANVEYIQSVYNGVGSEALGEAVRGLLDMYLGFFDLAVIIHDFDFSAKDIPPYHIRSVIENRLVVSITTVIL